MANEYDFFQFNPGSVGDDWEGGDRAPQMRPIDSRISNYNAMYIGDRRSDDYTRTVYQWEFGQNKKPERGVGFGVDAGWYEHNPYVWGSTVKKLLDDQGFKMGMSHDTGVDLDAPNRDVSDKNELDASGMVSFKNYPTEGVVRFRIGQKGVKPGNLVSNSWFRPTT